MAEKKREMSKQAAPGIGLFATPFGVRAVQSPARAQILSVLAERELPFDEIVKQSGKAKSTVSVHLQGLVREGIVSEKTDLNDSRKKIFYLKSPYIGGLAVKKPAIRQFRTDRAAYCRAGSLQVLPADVPDNPGVAFKRGDQHRPVAQKCRVPCRLAGVLRHCRTRPGSYS